MGTILSIRDLWKIYPNGTIANQGVNVDIEEGTVHAIVGENGAGKTTLMKIVFGITQAKSGTITLRGEPFAPAQPSNAIQAGVGMVHQHLMLAPDLTVAENIVLGVEPKRAGVFFDFDTAVQTAREISEKFHLPVPVDKQINELPVGTRQRVEILKALYRNAELLILDEPTAVLTPQESEVLFETLDRLKEQGKTIVFISHKLKEVKQIADTVTIMRAARVVDTQPASGLSVESIAELMVGRKIDLSRVPAPEQVGPARLSVRGLSMTRDDGVQAVRDISFEVAGGEILGVAGVEGNGQTELVRALVGLLPVDSGDILVGSTNIATLNPKEIRQLGVSHIPEDRMEDGVAPLMSIQENVIVDRYDKPEFSTRLRIFWKKVLKHTIGLIEEYRVHAGSPRNDIASLSGGNIQKCVVARELSADPDVVVASQPTRGVDIGSWEHLHSLIVEARDKGRAVFLVSADLDEVLKLSTRIIVMFEGEIVARFDDASNVTAPELGPYMLGIKRQEESSATVSA